MAPAARLIGLGSAHGDDRVGWKIAEILAPQFPPGEVARLHVPLDLLDGIAAAGILGVCDACHADGIVGDILRWDGPSGDWSRARLRATHGVGLAEALSLAGNLGMLPRRLIVWGITVRQPVPATDLSAELAAALPGIVRAIERDWQSARQGEACHTVP